MANKNYFINGITELLILSLLNERDMYVYEMVKAVENHSGGLLAISQNTLYTSTYKLIGEGMLSEYTKLVGKRRTRVYYHLEPAGAEYLRGLEDNYRRNTEGVNNIMEAIGSGVVAAEAPNPVIIETEVSGDCAQTAEGYITPSGMMPSPC